MPWELEEDFLHQPCKTPRGSTSEKKNTKCNLRESGEVQQSLWDPITSVPKGGTETILSNNIKWQLLEERRKTARPTVMYRIANDEIDIPSDRCYLTRVTRHSRHNSFKRCIPQQIRLQSHEHYFPSNYTRVESITWYIIQAPSPEVFRISLQLQ